MAARRHKKANRKNAKLSTAPRTREGKARSSQDARKHGLFARDTVLPGENPEEFLQLIADLEQELEAESGFERRLVSHIAVTEWRMRRLVRLETGALTDQLDKERRHAQRVQAALGDLNQDPRTKPGGRNQNPQPEHGGETPGGQSEQGPENTLPPAGSYQQTTKELGAVVVAYRDAPVLLILSLYESRLTRKYFCLLKQLRQTQKLRRATEDLEAPNQLAEAAVSLSTTEPAQAQYQPTAPPGGPTPRPPLSESQQTEHPPTPSTARGSPQEATSEQPEKSAA